MWRQIIFHILIIDIIRISSWLYFNYLYLSSNDNYQDSSINRKKYRLGLDYVKRSTETLNLNVCANIHIKSIRLLHSYKIDIYSYMRDIFKQTSLFEVIKLNHND
ncbi:hypothetical protein HZS_3745 [Henneguya salminicola]|nr:hypothetical protein HZS_3745 [Henneguya salminicola]